MSIRNVWDYLSTALTADEDSLLRNLFPLDAQSEEAATPQGGVDLLTGALNNGQFSRREFSLIEKALTLVVGDDAFRSQLNPSEALKALGLDSPVLAQSAAARLLAPTPPVTGSTTRFPYVRRSSVDLPKTPPAETLAMFQEQGINPKLAFFAGPNRGDPMLRFVRMAKELRQELGYDIPIIVMYGDGDENADYVAEADYAIYVPHGIDPDTGKKIFAYNNIPAVFAALEDFQSRTGIQISHVFPGWGFVSENDQFAAQVEAHGMKLIGPTSKTMAMVGPKTTAKEIAKSLGIPVAEGSDILPLLPDGSPDMDAIYAIADKIGYPLMIKPVDGGGGKGQYVVETREELKEKIVSALNISKSSFGSNRLLVERFVEEVRHVEVQMLGDQVVGYRVCSAQRNKQKVFEWAGPGILPPEIERQLREYSHAYAKKVGYKGPGTIEYMLDKNGQLFFGEMNARLQVEHGVTEMSYGIDVLKEATRREIGLKPDAIFNERVSRPPSKFALQLRVLAENVEEGFRPSPGLITFMKTPHGPNVRIDEGVSDGGVVNKDYDNMIMKLIVTGDTWEEAVATLEAKIRELDILGVDVNLEFALEFLNTDEMRQNGGMGVNVNFMETYLLVRKAYMQAHKNPGAFKPENAFLEKYGTDWKSIKRPFMVKEPAPLIEALVRAYLNGETVACAEIGRLVNRYRNFWEKPKPYMDEAVLAVALHGYYERRAEISNRLLSPGSELPFNPDTLPSSEGLSFQAEVDGKTASIHVREVTISHFAVTVNGHTVFVDAKRRTPNNYSIHIYGERRGKESQFNALVGARGGQFLVKMRGITHNIKLGSGGGKDNKGEVPSPMPGTVFKVFEGTKVGQRVNKNDKLLIVEAMKMENEIRAPMAGVIKKIHVQAGNAVSSGQVLVEIEPDSDASANGDSQKYEFMKDHRLGARAQLEYLDRDARPDEFEAVMADIRSRLDKTATDLVLYIQQYLQGFDYSKKPVDLRLSLLREVKDPKPALKGMLLKTLEQYADLLELFSQHSSDIRSEFHVFLRHFKDAGFKISAQLTDALRRNFRHYGINIPEGQAIAPNDTDIRSHTFTNVLLRLRQAWLGGRQKRDTIVALIKLAAQYKMTEAEPILQRIHAFAGAGHAEDITRAVVQASKALGLALSRRLNGHRVPERHEPLLEALKDNRLMGMTDDQRLALNLSLVEDPKPIEEAGIQNERIKRLATVYGARVSRLAVPQLASDAGYFDGYEAYLFRTTLVDKKAGKSVEQDSIVVYSQHEDAIRLQHDEQGQFIGEAGLEERYIRSTRLLGIYNALLKAQSKPVTTENQVLMAVPGEVVYKDPNGPKDRTFNQNNIQVIGENVQAFGDGVNLARTVVFASYKDATGQPKDAAFRFEATKEGELIQVRGNEDDYFRVEDVDTRKHHLKGKLTVEERARAFFDGGVYEEIKIKGVDDTGKRNAIVIAKGLVNGREVVSYFSDARVSGGAVGAAEGKKMVAAAFYAYLKGLNIVGHNDSGGAKIPDGTPSLDYSAIDFFIKAAARQSPEEFTRLVEAHPHHEFFTSLLEQFGDGRSLMDQVKGKQPPVHIALMVGANSGMVVYGPAELLHIFMRSSPEVFGVLTGSGVVYEVKNVLLPNGKIGGALVLMNRAGTADKVFETEDQLFAWAKKILAWFDGMNKPTSAEIQRVAAVAAEEEAVEQRPTNVTIAELKANVDAGDLYHYKDEFKGSNEVLTSYARIGGSLVALLGPVYQDGFGSAESIEKADRFVRAAAESDTPIIKIIGQKWITVSKATDGIAKRREEFSAYLASAKQVPQISILTHPSALESTIANQGSHIQIFIKSSSTTAYQLWQAKNKGCVIVESFKEAMDYSNRFIKFWKAARLKDFRMQTADAADRATVGISETIPEDFNKPYDIQRVIAEIFDQGSFLEVGVTDPQDQEGSNLITGLAFLNGRAVGIFADHPQIRAGAADAMGADKYRRFVELCTSLKIPMIYLEDSPGFEPGVDQEGKDIQGRGGKLLEQIVLSPVPKVKLVLRKSNGGRNIQGFHPWLSPGTVALALRKTLIAVMGARGGIPFTFKDERTKAVFAAIPEEAKKLTEFLGNVQEHLTPELQAKVAGGIADIKSVYKDFEAKRLDSIKTFLSNNADAVRAELEASKPSEVEAFDTIVRTIRRLVSEMDALVVKYNNEVADPNKSLVNGILDKIIDPSDTRRALIAALDEATNRAAAATRAYATLTDGESRVAYARARLQGAGLRPIGKSVSAYDASQDLIGISGLKGWMTASEALDLLEAVADVQDPAVRRKRAADYLALDTAGRTGILKIWRQGRFIEDMAARLAQDPYEAVQAILAAAESAPADAVTALQEGLARLVRKRTSDTAPLPRIEAQAPTQEAINRQAAFETLKPLMALFGFEANDRFNWFVDAADSMVRLIPDLTDTGYSLMLIKDSQDGLPVDSVRAHTLLSRLREMAGTIGADLSHLAGKSIDVKADRRNSSGALDLYRLQVRDGGDGVDRVKTDTKLDFEDVAETLDLRRVSGGWTTGKSQPLSSVVVTGTQSPHVVIRQTVKDILDINQIIGASELAALAGKGDFSRITVHVSQSGDDAEDVYTYEVRDGHLSKVEEASSNKASELWKAYYIISQAMKVLKFRAPKASTPSKLQFERGDHTFTAKLEGKTLIIQGEGTIDEPGLARAVLKLDPMRVESVKVEAGDTPFRLNVGDIKARAAQGRAGQIASPDQGQSPSGTSIGSKGPVAVDPAPAKDGDGDKGGTPSALYQGAQTLAKVYELARPMETGADFVYYGDNLARKLKPQASDDAQKPAAPRWQPRIVGEDEAPAEERKPARIIRKSNSTPHRVIRRRASQPDQPKPGLLDALPKPGAGLANSAQLFTGNVVPLFK